MKGISSFIATVLLISFTLSVGIIFSNWVVPLFRTQADDITVKQNELFDCSGARLYFEEDSLKANGTRLSLIAENRGSVNLTDFRIYVTLNDSSFVSFDNPINYNITLQPAQQALIYNTSSINKTSIEQIILTTGPNAQCTSVQWKVEP